MTKIIEINACWRCTFYSDKIYCKKSHRKLILPISIPSWCPLPDKEVDEDYEQAFGNWECPVCGEIVNPINVSAHKRECKKPVGVSKCQL